MEAIKAIEEPGGKTETSTGQELSYLVVAKKQKYPASLLTINCSMVILMIVKAVKDFAIALSVPQAIEQCSLIVRSSCHNARTR